MVALLDGLKCRVLLLRPRPRTASLVSAECPWQHATAKPCLVASLAALGFGLHSVERRSHREALVGSIVWSTTASSSVESASRSTWWRRRALKASIVLVVS
jgi:hypothetical protein